MFGLDRIEIKSIDEILRMREAGLVVADALAAVQAAVAVGVTTAELDAVAAEVIAARGARSSFLGYQGYPPRHASASTTRWSTGSPGTA